MAYRAVPAFLGELQAKPSFGRLALEFTVLTAARSQETRLATWGEIDLEAKLWTCPGDHMKRGKAHIVPLSEAALAVLRKAAALKLAGSNLIFPGVSGGSMSDMTLLKVLRDADEPFHVHGFRSTFTDWAADKTTFANAVVDAAKAHKTPDATEAAYRRTTHLEKRATLMEAWGAYCSSRAGGKVIDFPMQAAQ